MYVPCGWDQGAKLNNIRVISGFGGIRRAKKGVIFVPAFFCFPHLFVRNIPRTFSLDNVENSTNISCYDLRYC